MPRPTPAEIWISELLQTCFQRYNEEELRQISFEITENDVLVRAEPTASGQLLAGEAIFVAEKLLREGYCLTVVEGENVLDRLSPNDLWERAPEVP